MDVARLTNTSRRNCDESEGDIRSENAGRDRSLMLLTSSSYNSRKSTNSSGRKWATRESYEI